jgi:hypothetical protein
MKEDKEEPNIIDHETIEHIDNYFNGDEECVMARKMAESIAFLDKPFGISWDLELVKEFLEERGYKVIIRLDDKGEQYYSVFPKDDNDDVIPDFQNIMDIFSYEVQKSLLTWLLQIGD